MRPRYALSVLLLLATMACGQSTSPTSPTPTPTCTYALSTNSTINGYPEGGSFTVAVITTPVTGCIWSVTTTAPWIHVTAGGPGNASGDFTFTVDANPGPPRSAMLTIASQTITFNQTSETRSACTYGLSIGSEIDGYPAGGTFDVAVSTTPQACNWSAASSATWIQITRGGSGSGPGVFTFAIDANPGPRRTGTLTVADKRVTINQSSLTASPGR